VYFGSCPLPFKALGPSEYVFEDDEHTIRVYYVRGQWTVSCMQFVGGPKPWETWVADGFGTKEDAANALNLRNVEDEDRQGCDRPLRVSRPPGSNNRMDQTKGFRFYVWSDTGPRRLRLQAFSGTKLRYRNSLRPGKKPCRSPMNFAAATCTWPRSKAVT
jgi:hypothetical protein